MTETAINVDPQELRKFDSIASRWWDPQGEFKTLHDINPLRLHYIDSRARLVGKHVLDVGCGGGLLAEGMALRGATVMGIDMAAASLTVARLHSVEIGSQVEYRETTVEQLAELEPESFDVVTCMEMLEHVPDPVSVIKACARLAKPAGGVFFSTLNRNPKAYLHAIVGAEYLLKLLPQGTHDYARFIRPSELEAWARTAGLILRDLTGLTYNPLTRRYALESDISVNYLAYAEKDS